MGGWRLYVPRSGEWEGLPPFYALAVLEDGEEIELHGELEYALPAPLGGWYLIDLMEGCEYRYYPSTLHVARALLKGRLDDEERERVREVVIRVMDADGARVLHEERLRAPLPEPPPGEEVGDERLRAFLPGGPLPEPSIYFVVADPEAGRERYVELPPASREEEEDVAVLPAPGGWYLIDLHEGAYTVYPSLIDYACDLIDGLLAERKGGRKALDLLRSAKRILVHVRQQGSGVIYTEEQRGEEEERGGRSAAQPVKLPV